MEEERRQHKRSPINAECQVYILFPEETFQPHYDKGTLLDLSLRGARVTIGNVNRQLFPRLLRPNGFLKILFPVPQREAPLKLIGRIVWLDYDHKGEGLNAGVFFESLDPEVEQVLKEILASY